ncbi:PilW family protein [Cupriavidus lacunae]|uniref:PilW family protein n=1 Tax=Cupriavidus lacunae TaxID=2666307 RepID=UPI001374DD0D|nr:hypothetical protein [Cupriavidus lacunae]
MLSPISRQQSGYSLIGLMVGMVVSLIVLWGMSAVYLNFSRGNQVTTTATQLNQDMRAVMDIMVNDIRRAGYWGNATKGANPFTAAATNLEISGSSNCILYSYDATFAGGAPGVVDSNAAFMDFFGFRLSGGAVQTLLPTANLASTSTSTQCGTDAIWENLTDQRAITVTALTFDTIGSKCISYLPATYDPTNTTTFTAWTTTGGSLQACSPAAAGAPVTYPPATNTFVETRRINISLTAQSKTDSTIVRTLNGTVLVRNNRVITP